MRDVREEMCGKRCLGRDAWGETRGERRVGRDANADRVLTGIVTGHARPVTMRIEY